MDTPPSQGPPAVPEPDEDGNYDSRALKALRRVWEDFCQEIATDENVMGVIQEVGFYSLAQLRGLEQQVDQGISDPENESFGLIFDAFELVVEACDFMALEFAEEIPEDLEEPEEGFFEYGLALVQDATNQMMEGHKLAMEHIEAMSYVNCPFCSHLNYRENAKCDKCGRSMPTAPTQSGGAVNLKEHQGLERPDAVPDGEVTKNYVMASQLLEAWKAGAVSPEQLAESLDNLEQNFAGHLKELEQQEKMLERAPDSQRDALFEALDKTRHGLDMSLEAVAKMRQAFDRQDDRYLFFGLTDLEEASKLLVEAFWDNKEAVKK